MMEHLDIGQNILASFTLFMFSKTLFIYPASTSFYQVNQKKTYVEMFSLLQECVGFDFKIPIINLDFEKSGMNQFQRIYPDRESLEN